MPASSINQPLTHAHPRTDRQGSLPRLITSKLRKSNHPNQNSEPPVRTYRPPVGVDRRRRRRRRRRRVLLAGEPEDEARRRRSSSSSGVQVVVVVVRRHGHGHGHGSGDDGAERPVLASAGAHGDVAQRAARRPVAVAVLAEVARLVDVVVVEVAELGVPAPAPRARQRRRRRRGRRGARLHGVLLLLMVMVMMPRARVLLLLLLPFAVVALVRSRSRPAAAAGVLVVLVHGGEVVVGRRRLPLHHRLVALVRVVPLPREGRGPRRRGSSLRRRRRGALGALRDDLAEQLEPAGGHLDVGQHLEGGTQRTNSFVRQGKQTPTPVGGSASRSY
jgi:hypothetical protein